MTDQLPLEEKVKLLPREPGVYQFVDPSGTRIYIGKALDLRARVGSYFTTVPDEKVWRIREEAVDLDFIATHSEREALLLEQTLIKRHKPKFNVRLTDDKKYPYIKVTDEAYPRVVYTRDLAGKGTYFGPFPDAGAAKYIARLLNKSFKLRQCRTLPASACIYYHMHQCLAPCIGAVPKAQYGEATDAARSFLRGGGKELVGTVKRKMAEHAARQEFEQAAQLRDMWMSMEAVLERQVAFARGLKDRDVVGLDIRGDRACCFVLFHRDGHTVGKEHYFLSGCEGQTKEGILAAFLAQFYGDRLQVPREILLPVDLHGVGTANGDATDDEREGPSGDEAGATVRGPRNGEPADGDPRQAARARPPRRQPAAAEEGPVTHVPTSPRGEGAALEEMLSAKRGTKVRLLNPSRGDARRLVTMAEKNAALLLAQEFFVRERQTGWGLAELQGLLGLPAPPHLIEGFDVSHHGGEHTVASMVVFKDGQPDKNRYRRFKVRTADGGDDYGAMEEILRRRYTRAIERDEPFPDLILIDGGRGQLNAACKVLAELQVEEQAVCGLAKQEEEVYLPTKLHPVKVPLSHEGLKLLIRVRNEAHRFAIRYQDTLKRRASVKSRLLDVPGIGPKRAKTLLTHFGSMKRLMDASVGEIAQVKGFTYGSATMLRMRLDRLRLVEQPTYREK